MIEQVDIRDAFFDCVLEYSRKNKNILVLSADMNAFSLATMEKELPDQYYNVGVSEQNMINLAAGLALSGKIVFCYSIATFATLRCYEQIKVNICSMNLPIAIVGAGAGFSFGYDGPTHHGHQDLSTMRLLPEMEIIELSSNDVAEGCVSNFIDNKKPNYIRLDKGPFPNWRDQFPADFSKGYRTLRDLCSVNIITNGFMTKTVIKVADHIIRQGKRVGVVDLFKVKPINSDFISEVLMRSSTIISVEESCITGGLATSISELITRNKLNCNHISLGAPDKQFVEYGSRDWFHEKYKLNVDGIIEALEAHGLEFN